MIAGHRFTLSGHFDADGAYVLTEVEHAASLTADAGQRAGLSYSNTFTCIPLELPFRPRRVTPKPIVQGTQTAVVVGPAGEEIFTDKYGRVKVQFHWDRQGKNDAEQLVLDPGRPAGRGRPPSDIPRIGQEVVVAFLEGDPDRPIVIGRHWP